MTLAVGWDVKHETINVSNDQEIVDQNESPTPKIRGGKKLNWQSSTI